MIIHIAGQIAFWVTVFVLANIIFAMWQDRYNYSLRFSVWKARIRRNLQAV